MKYKTKEKIANIIISLVPSSKLRRKFKIKLGISNYEKNRSKYNIGKNSYMSINALCINKDNVEIGKYCSISRDVIIAPGQHPLDRISMHPFTYDTNEHNSFGSIVTPQEKIIPYIQKKTKIGNDVWIGIKAIIQDGVNIGDGAVIGSGAIVTKDIPPYAVAVGVPAKVIKYRFSQDVIDKLLELKWWDYPEEFIVNNLPFDDINKCIKILEENKNLNTCPKE